MEAISDWITPVIVVAVSGIFWRHLVRLERRFDRRFDRVDDLAREVSANGRAIARLEGRHEGHPLATRD